MRSTEVILHPIGALKQGNLQHRRKPDSFRTRSVRRPSGLVQTRLSETWPARFLRGGHFVARVRNAGAAAAHGEVLVFVDADTIVPHEFLDRVREVMIDPLCLGDSAEIVHHVRSQVLRAYLGAWRWIGFKLGMAQGAAQFCRAPAFRILKGYDESQFMGEDVDFHWRLRKLCARSSGHVEFLSDVKVIPSPRRFDTAPVWRTLIWTNPVFIWAFRKVRSAWAAWYVTPPR